MPLLESILLFISKWVGTAIPRIATAFLGLICAIVSAVGLWDRRIRALPGAVGIGFGLLMVFIALDPRVLHFIAQTTHFVRIRILMTFLSFVMIVITVEAIRRSHLQERYAILWIATGMIILATAFFPQILNIFRLVLGSDYVAAVIGILFTFLLLIVFHFSISLSTLRKNQTHIVQKLALIEQNLSDLAERIKEYHPSWKTSCTTEFPMRIPVKTPGDRIEDHGRKTTRSMRGTHVSVAFIIPFAVLSVLFIGLKTPEPMVGDEVTHYYMLVKQSKSLSRPNFYAQIPVEYGESIERRYPHPFLWHYLGAVFYKFGGEQFFVVQIYQALFWAQLLVFSYLLTKSRNGIEDRSSLLYLIIIASLPVALIFSVTFYQDVPMTAQAVTAFYFLRQRRWLTSTLFLCFAIGLKVTAILFLPAFFLLNLFNEIRSREWFWGSLRFICSAAVVFIFIMSMGQIIKTHAETDFYPAKKMQEIISKAKHVFKANDDSKPKKAAAKEVSKQRNGNHPKKPRPVTPYEAEIIANHPGDLRIPENYFVYGGILIWIVFLVGIISFVCGKFGLIPARIPLASTRWLFLVGLSYTLIAFFMLRNAPDARFFLPGLPFLLLPFVESCIRIPKSKIFIAILSALAVLQAGYVLSKTYHLRNVTPELLEAIEFLKEKGPTPKTVFMYPEGNYRLFPVPHEWYLNYRLREFWKADNDTRIKMLYEFRIGAVVVKKHLISAVDPEIINLGVYPDYFVRDLRNDARFEKVFENKGVIVFRVPTQSVFQ